MVDLMLYHAEEDLLALRLAVLVGRVRLHCIVEASETFSGLPKVPTLPSDPRFGAEWDRLSLLVPERLATADPWAREAFQRDCLLRLISGVADDVLVLIGDVDEIPDPDALPESAQQLPATDWGPMGVFRQSHRAYDVRNVREEAWMGTIATTAGTLRRLGVQHVRDLRRSGIPMVGGGWHFTHMGGLARLQGKLDAFSHQELNTPDQRSQLPRRIAEGVDPFGRQAERYRWRQDADRPRPLVDHPAMFPSLWRDPLPEASA